MKRKISMAFSFACIWIICMFTASGPSISGLITSAINNFSLTNILDVVCSVVYLLTPIAIVILLIMNTKKDITKELTLVLLTFCISKIISTLLGFNVLFEPLPKYDGIVAVSYRVCSVATSLIIIVLSYLAMQSIKKRQTRNGMKALAIITIVLNVFYFVLVLATRSISSVARGTSLISLFTPITLSACLFVLPKTIYDYENCAFLTTKRVVCLCVVVVCIIGLTVISTAPPKEPSCGHESCAENGPFYCIGKNDTCKNKTECAYDLYCDECD